MMNVTRFVLKETVFTPLLEFEIILPNEQRHHDHRNNLSKHRVNQIKGHRKHNQKA